MKVAFVIYNGLTMLDFAGVYDPVTRLKTMGFVGDLEYDICARTGRVRTFEGVVLLPDRVGSDLAGYDCVIVPGGDGVRDLVRDRNSSPGSRPGRRRP
jgi:cyclohexyl-isocyanide hydratase